MKTSIPWQTTEFPDIPVKTEFHDIPRFCRKVGTVFSRVNSKSNSYNIIITISKKNDIPPKISKLPQQFPDIPVKTEFPDFAESANPVFMG